jgi:hypothetical protein
MWRRRFHQPGPHLDGVLRHRPIGFAGLFDQLRTCVDLPDGALDQTGRVPGRLGGALGQIPDFTGHHGEPCARLSGPSRLHRRVQASRLVWKAISSMVLMIFPISRPEEDISSMAEWS